jgi:hypothetical protein
MLTAKRSATSVMRTYRQRFSPLYRTIQPGRFINLPCGQYTSGEQLGGLSSVFRRLMPTLPIGETRWIMQVGKGVVNSFVVNIFMHYINRTYGRIPSRSRPIEGSGRWGTPCLSLDEVTTTDGGQDGGQ